MSDENFERWRNAFSKFNSKDGPKQFPDMTLHKSLGVMIVVNEGTPRWTVDLHRGGFNGVGEEMGIVEVRRIERLFTGEEPDLEEKLKAMYDDVMAGVPDPTGVIRYTAPLEQAQGYAQGVYDGLRALLDVAERRT